MLEKSTWLSDKNSQLRFPAMLGYLVWVAVLTRIACQQQFPLVDDAFITFRYAFNFAQGLGLVYNPGENALGVTTPLWAMLLSIFIRNGADPSFWAPALNLVALFSFGLVFQRYFQGFYKTQIPLGLLLCLLAFSFQTHACAFSGMETIPYSFVTLAALGAASTGNHVWAGLFAGICVLLRPDGVIALILVSVFPRSFKPGLRSLVAGLAVILPWCIYAYFTYGSPVPMSVAAKQLLHPATPIENANYVAQALLVQNIPDALLALVGGVGIVWSLRQPHLRLPVAWLVLYLLGICFSGVKPVFYWYYGPAWLWFITFGLNGFLDVLLARTTDAGLAEKKAHNVTATVCFVLVVFFVVSSLLRLRSLLTDDIHLRRDQYFHQIAAEFCTEIAPKDTIYLAETGILGFAFRKNYVIDAAGINSPKVLALMRQEVDAFVAKGGDIQRMDQETDWYVNIVRKLQPDWIIGWFRLHQIGLLEEQPWFQSEYTKVRTYAPDYLGGIGVYRRNQAHANNAQASTAEAS